MVMHYEQLPKRPLASFLRYGIVGLATNLIGYLAYLALTSWELAPKLAMTLLYVLSCSLGFFGNRRWTFSHQGSIFRSAIRYFIAHFMGYLMNLSILIVFADHLGYAHEYVQAVAILVVAVFLYGVFRFFVFAQPLEEQGHVS
jgi:putative flippase GtrA